MTRVSKDIAMQLLAAKGNPVVMSTPELVETVDGDPAGVTIAQHTGMLTVSPESLGWTQAELDDPTVTE